MPQSAGLIFTNDSGAGSGTSSYVQDTFPDYVFPPSNNTGFSSTISNNPLNANYANTEMPQFGAKYLPIKDLVFVQDRSQWINGKTTYKVIFFENYPQVQAYIFGNVSLQRVGGVGSISIKTIGDGISVNGVIRQVAFVLQPSTAGTATAQVAVDGSNQGTIDFSSYTTSSPTNPGMPAFNAYLHNSTPESYNIHDIRLTALQSSTLAINGIIVYFNAPHGAIDQFPGTSYVNKVKTTTSVGVSLAIPSFGSSMGGNALVYKTSVSGYTISALSATTIASTASGSSGTNLLSVAAGTGASFVAGYGVIVSQGSSTYVGSIISISTDTFTMGNTLGFGITAGSPVYTAWRGGNTLAINASLMALAFTLDFTRLVPSNGFSQTILDPQGRYAFSGKNIGLTQIDGNQCAVFLGASGFMQMDGYFSACELETIGNAIWSATLSVNGFASWSQQAGQTGVVKKTVFAEAGPGWNSFNIGVGASMGLAGIQRINLYQRSKDTSVSYGFLADYDIAQTYTNRDAINATMMALGGVQRTYADQIYFKATWLRGQTWTVPGGVYYQGASTNGSFSFQYYGTHYGIVGTLNAGSTLTLDGAGQTLTINVMQSVATLGFHTISYTGGTAIVSAIDFVNPIRSKVDAVFAPVSLTATPTIKHPTYQTFTGSTGTYFVPQNPAPVRIYIQAVGGGGGGGASDNAGDSVTGQAIKGTDTLFGPSLLIYAGGGGGGAGTNGFSGGVGGSFSVNYPAIQILGLPGQWGAASGHINNGNGFPGGSNPLGFGGQGSGAGLIPIPGVGYGGGGGSAASFNGSSPSACSGGAGGYVHAVINAPATSYNYVIGQGGSGGVSSLNGGTGMPGIIIIKEEYQ